MKKIISKIIVAIAIFIAAGLGGYKTYSIYNRESSNAELLLTENIEALTRGESSYGSKYKKGNDLKFCKEHSYYQCVYTGNPKDHCTHPC